jgi:hypothetical protein
VTGQANVCVWIQRRTPGALGETASGGYVVITGADVALVLPAETRDAVGV